MTAPTHTTDTKIGKTISHYRILQKIGQGGMSVVYLAENIANGNRCAIKLLHNFLSEEADCRTRLLREAKIVSKLNHPNIVKVLDYPKDSEAGLSRQELYIVSEYVDGVTLKEFAEKNELTKYPEVSYAIIQALSEAISYAHANDIIHRDIKPENILLGNDGSIKLMDFGIAHVGNEKSLTTTGTLIGSPAHMAPEIIEGKAALPASDIFSLTTLFYWLLTDKLPFDGNSPHSLLKKIVDCEFIAPEILNSRISSQISMIVAKGMKKNANERFKDGRELCEELKKNQTLSAIRVSPEKLKEILQNPSILPKLNAEVTKNCIRLGREQIKKGKISLALPFLNRVLSDDPSNLEVVSLLNYTPQNTQTTWAKLFPYLTPIVIASMAIAIAPINTLMVPKGPSIWLSHLDQMTLEVMTLETMSEPQPAGKSTKAAAFSTYALEVHVSPYADLYLDNKLIKKNAKYSKIELTKGEHTIGFKHQYASTESRSIIASGDSQLLAPLYVELERSKPSSLLVKCNENADIIVDGIYMGTSNQSYLNPIKIPIPNKNYATDVEIIISKQGFTPYIAKKKIIAGKTSYLDINLLPDDA